MKKIVFLLLLVVTISTTAAAQVYDETLNTMEQIDQAVAKAKAEGKYVICQVGGNWCPWCLKFAKFITEDAEIKTLIDKEFVYIHVNYPRRGGDRDAQAATMKRLGNAQRFGFPVMVVLDSDGKVIHLQDSSYLEEDKGYNKDKVMSFFKHWTKSAVEGTNTQQPSNAADNKDLKAEHIAFIKKLYDDFFINNSSWDDITPYYVKHCSPKIVETIKENYEYDCDDDDCYGWWIFRDMSQDSSGDIKVIVTHDHDNWYNARYIDLETVDVKIRVEGSGENLKITGLKHKGYKVNVE